MSPPEATPQEALSPTELRGLVGELIAEVDRLRAENRALRDEVARLKGLPPRALAGALGRDGAGAAASGDRRRLRAGAATLPAGRARPGPGDDRAAGGAARRDRRRDLQAPGGAAADLA